MAEITSVADRIKEAIKYLALSDSQFADKCEISRATLSLLLSGKNKKISDVMLSQIHKAFPEISINWILFGEGDIIEEKKTSDQPVIPSSGEYDTPLFSDEMPGTLENSNLKPLKSIEETIKKAVSEAVNQAIANFKTLDEIENSDKKAKKISHITVYYDDSTFETFTGAIK